MKTAKRVLLAAAATLGIAAAAAAPALAGLGANHSEPLAKR